MNKDKSLNPEIIVAAILTTVFLLYLLFNSLVTDEPYTELYFEDPMELPKKVKINESFDITFTVNNLENKKMTYRYQLIETISNRNKTKEYKYGGAEFMLEDNEAETITLTHRIKEPFNQTKITVALLYKNRNQSIHLRLDNENQEILRG